MKTILYKHINKQLLKDWLSLWKDSKQANFVNSPMWLSSIIESFGYKNYIIIAVYDEGRLGAVAWFVESTKYTIPFFTIPPGDFVYETPFLFASQNESVRKELLISISKLGNVFIDNVSAELINEIKRNIPYAASSPSSVNLSINIERKESGEAIIPNRKKLMKKVKDIEQTFLLKSYTKHTADVLETVFEIDNQSRKNNRGYNTFSTDEIKQFYVSLSRNFDKYFSVNILYLEDKPIAYRVGFIIGKTYYGSQIAFIAQYQDYYPGKVLLVKFIEETKNVDKIDFGSGDNFFKRSVATGSRPLFKIIISKNRFVRNYIKFLYFVRNIIFIQLSKQVKIYAAYRAIKKIHI